THHRFQAPAAVAANPGGSRGSAAPEGARGPQRPPAPRDLLEATAAPAAQAARAARRTDGRALRLLLPEVSRGPRQQAGEKVSEEPKAQGAARPGAERTSVREPRTAAATPRFGPAATLSSAC